jgi:adenosylmethionine-8-amino-7-oxononanoate aminotransferase
VGECGKQFCLKLRERGVLTRPILNTIVIMPPLSVTMDELKILVKAIKL